VPDGDDLREVMRRFPSGVAVVTVAVDGNRLGQTVSALVSLSLDPPLVGISIARQAQLHELLREAGGFAISLLAGGQEWLSQHFARSVPPIAMWHGVAHHEGSEGAPLLAGAIGWLECRLWAEHDAGDHTLFVGEVLAAELGEDAPPLVHVVFDLDGVIVDSEKVWDEVRERYVRDHGGRYDAEAQRAMMGMSSTEWSNYIHDELGVDAPPEQINGDVVELMAARYREQLPLIPGARGAVARMAATFPLGLASSSNRELINIVLELAGLAEFFRATVSSEEVPRGKPAPDVYLEVAQRLDVAPESCAAVEDSQAGIRSAKAAGMRVMATPNPHYPPDAGALAEADVVLASIRELTPDMILAHG
jgi:HAD superfamily hydrolase (TIGR01509 family)